MNLALELQPEVTVIPTDYTKIISSQLAVFGLGWRDPVKLCKLVHSAHGVLQGSGLAEVSGLRHSISLTGKNT